MAPGGPPSYYAHALTRHMHQWGSTKEDFANIAVVTREWAGLNPRAVMFSEETNKFGGPITVKDVIDSRMIIWPLNLLDICLVTDHGGAVLISSAEKARSFKTAPVWIAGAGESQSHAGHAGDGRLHGHVRGRVQRDRLPHGRHGSW